MNKYFANSLPASSEEFLSELTKELTYHLDNTIKSTSINSAHKVDNLEFMIRLILHNLELLPEILETEKDKAVAEALEEEEEDIHDRVYSDAYDSGYSEAEQIADGQVGDLEGKIIELEEEISNLKDEVRDLEEQIVDLKDEVASLETDTAALSSEVSDLTNEVSDLTNEVTDADAAGFDRGWKAGMEDSERLANEPRP